MSTAIEVSNVKIHRIVEQEGPFFEAMHFFPTMTRELLDENRGWLQPRFLDASDRLMLCIQSYIVKTPHHTIMIDSCVGNHKPRPTRPFWNMMNSDRYEKNLAASGFDHGLEFLDLEGRRDIDDVAPRRQHRAVHAFGAAEFQSGKIGHARGDIEIERIDPLLPHHGLGARNALQALIDADRRHVAAHVPDGGKLRLRRRTADTHRHEKPFLIVIS